MKQYLLLLRSSDFSKSNNIWTSNPINLYSNTQFKNYSYSRSAYGLNLIGDRTYVGTEVTSPSYTGIHATPYSSNVTHKTNVGEIIYEPATPALKRFVDTTSRIDILTYRHTFTNLPGVIVPTFNITFYEADSSAGPWLRSSVSSDSNIVFIKNAKPFVKIELEIFTEDVDLSAIGLLFYLEIGIYNPVSPVISSSVRNILKRFPSWTSIFEDSVDPATPSLAIPESVGGKFMTAILQESLDNFQSDVELNSIDSYIASADESMTAWMFIAYSVPQNINIIKGDNIPLARVGSFAELMDGRSTDYSFYYSPIDRQLFTLRKFSNLFINDTSYTQEAINIFNDFDEFGARLSLPRLYLESNSNYKKRILDVNQNMPGVSNEALKRTLRRELDIWRAYGATPDSEYSGATPEILEISDIENSTPYFTDAGQPTERFRQLVEDVNFKYPSNIGYVKWDEGVWDYAGANGEGVSRVPAVYDQPASPLGSFYQAGVGDFDDAMVEIYPAESSTISFSGNIKISGFKTVSTEKIYAPVVVDYNWYCNYIATVADYDSSKVQAGVVYEISMPNHANYATPSTFYVNLNYNNRSDFTVGNKLLSNSPSSPEYTYIPIFDQQGMTLAELEFRDKVFNQRYYNSTRSAKQNSLNIAEAASINVIFGRSLTAPGVSPVYTNLSVGNYKIDFSRSTPIWKNNPTIGTSMTLATPNLDRYNAGLYLGSNVYATKQDSFYSDIYKGTVALNTPNTLNVGGVSNALIQIDELVRKTVLRHQKATPQYLYVAPNKINSYPAYGSSSNIEARGGYSVDPISDDTYLVPSSPNLLWQPRNIAGNISASPDYFDQATINFSSTPYYLDIYTKESVLYPFVRTNYEDFEAETAPNTFYGLMDENNRVFKNEEEYKNSFLLQDKFLETVTLNRNSFGLAAATPYIIDSFKINTTPNYIDSFTYSNDAVISDLNAAFAADPSSLNYKTTPLKDAVFYLDANNASFNAQVLNNLGTGGNVLNAQVGSSALDNTAYIRNGALVLPGSTSNYGAIYDHNGLDIAGDIEIVVKLNVTTPIAEASIISKGLAYRLILGVNPDPTKIKFGYWNGSSWSEATSISGAIIPNKTQWIKVSRVKSSGLVSFYVNYSSQDIEPSSWILLNTAILSANTALPTSVNYLEIGSRDNGISTIIGFFYRVILRAGISSQTVADVDFSKQKDWTIEFNEDSIYKSAVTVVSTNSILADPTLLDAEDKGYFYQPSTTSSTNGVSIPSPVGSTTDITSNLALAVEVRPFETSVDKPLFFKRQSGVDSGVTCYGIGFSAAASTIAGPKMYLNYGSSADTTVRSVYAVKAHNISVGTKAWFGATLTINNTTFQHTVKFYTSLDGVNWTLFDTVVTANPSGTALTLRSNAANIYISSSNVGIAGVEGKYYRAKIWNTDSFAGNPVLDVDFDALTSASQVNLVCTTGQVATFNRHTAGRKMIVMPSKVKGGRSVWSFGGDAVADYMLVPNNDLLNFGLNDSFTFLAVLRIWPTPAADQRIIMKWIPSSGYYFSKTSGGVYALNYDSPAGGAGGAGAPAYTNGVLGMATGIRNTTTDLTYVYNNTFMGVPAVDSTIGTLSNTAPLTIGSQHYNTTGYADMELAAVAIWRRALTDQEIKTVKEYLIDGIVPSFSSTDLNNVDVDIYSEKDEIRQNNYRLGVNSGWVYIKEKEQYIYVNPETATYNGRFFELTLPNSPRKGAPIIANVGGKDYRNLVFEDSSTPGVGSFYNTETVLGRKSNSLYLSYQNIKNASVTDIYTGKTLFSNLSSGTNVISPFNQATPSVVDREYEVVYYVNDAFYVDNDVYNSSVDDYQSKAYFSTTPSTNSYYYVTYENSYKDNFIDSGLNLSQIDSPISEGYVYLTKDEFNFSSISAHLSPSFITDSYDDLMYLSIISYDINGNLKPGQTFYISGSGISVTDPYVTTNDNGFAKTTIKYTGTIPATSSSGVITISGIGSATPNGSLNSGTQGYVKQLTYEILRGKTFDLKVKAAPLRFTVDTDGISKLAVVGKIYWKDNPLLASVAIKYRKARTLYNLFNTASYSYTQTDSNGYFNIFETINDYSQITDPGTWFVSVEINENINQIQSKLIALGFTIIDSNSSSYYPILNKDFENWTGSEPTGWYMLWPYPRTATISRSTDSYTGTYSALTSFSGASQGQFFGTSEFPVSAGQQVVVTFWAKCNNAGGVTPPRIQPILVTGTSSIAPDFFQSPPATQMNGSTYNLTTQYAAYTYTFTVGESQTRARVFAYLLSGSGSSISINLDAASIQASNITITGDVTYWNEKYDNIHYANEAAPLPSAFTPATQLNSAPIATPNFVVKHHNGIDIYSINSTPNWVPPSWVPLNRLQQYQMGLFGTTPNYISNYGNIHPDSGEE